MDIEQAGPAHFAVLFLLFSVLFFVVQRITGRPITDKYPRVYICTSCYTTQHRDEKKCTCGAPLDPLSNWKWI